MDSVTGQRELGTHRPPVGQVGRRLDTLDPRQRHSAGREARLRQQPTPCELSHVDWDASSAR